MKRMISLSITGCSVLVQQWKFDRMCFRGPLFLPFCWINLFNSTYRSHKNKNKNKIQLIRTLYLKVGHETSYVMPIVEGFELRDAITACRISGRHVSDYLKTLLEERGIWLHSEQHLEAVRIYHLFEE